MKKDQEVVVVIGVVETEVEEAVGLVAVEEDFPEAQVEVGLVAVEVDSREGIPGRVFLDKTKTVEPVALISQPQDWWRIVNKPSTDKPRSQVAILR